MIRAKLTLIKCIFHWLTAAAARGGGGVDGCLGVGVDASEDEEGDEEYRSSWNVWLCLVFDVFETAAGLVFEEVEAAAEVEAPPSLPGHREQAKWEGDSLVDAAFNCIRLR